MLKIALCEDEKIKGINKKLLNKPVKYENLKENIINCIKEIDIKNKS
ncbi:Uncharacterised protein [uncultured Clostridium sp.]|nr:Uncharacterised protein [uncultured Clostridium sp.]SCI99138.1 Uncharacterised protein [uncultured Clostridium sp.]